MSRKGLQFVRKNRKMYCTTGMHLCETEKIDDDDLLHMSVNLFIACIIICAIHELPSSFWVYMGKCFFYLFIYYPLLILC